MSEWYFMSGGEQQGPVNAAQLKALAASGTLKPEDLVWNQSMADWAPARRVKGLPFAGQPAASKPAVSPSSTAATIRRAPAAAAAVPEPDPEPAPSQNETFERSEADDEPVSDSSQKIESERTADAQSPGDTAALMGNARAWVGVMSLLFLAAIGLVIAYEAWRVLPVAKGASTKALFSNAQTIWGIRQIVRTIGALLMLIPWLSLMKFGSALGRAESSGSIEDVNHACRAQVSFWKNMAVTSILVILMCVGAYIYKMVLKK